MSLITQGYGTPGNIIGQGYQSAASEPAVLVPLHLLFEVGTTRLLHESGDLLIMEQAGPPLVVTVGPRVTIRWPDVPVVNLVSPGRTVIVTSEGLLLESGAGSLLVEDGGRFLLESSQDQTQPDNLTIVTIRRPAIPTVTLVWPETETNE